MPELAMDRGKQRLAQHLAAVQWLLDHWEYLPDDLYRKLPKKNADDQDVFVPFDIRQYLYRLMQGDLANIVTLSNNWRELAEMDGFITDDSTNSEK